MQELTLTPIAEHLSSMYEEELSQPEKLMAARRLVDFVELLLKIDAERQGAS